MSDLKSDVLASPLESVETPLLAVAVPDGRGVPASLAALDQAAGGALARALATGDFKGKKDETSLLYPPGGRAQRVLLVGVGKGERTHHHGCDACGERSPGVAAKRARTLGATRFAFGGGGRERDATHGARGTRRGGRRGSGAGCLGLHRVQEHSGRSPDPRLRA